jgi:hypothetical protein
MGARPVVALAFVLADETAALLDCFLKENRR